MQGSAPEASIATSAPGPNSHSLIILLALFSALSLWFLKLVVAAYCYAKFDMLHEAFVEAIEQRLEELKTQPEPTQYPQDVAKARRRVQRLLRIPHKVRRRTEEVSGQEKSRTEQRVTEVVADILREKEVGFKEMICRAKYERANCRFQLPPQFQDKLKVNSKRSLPGPSDGEDRCHKRARNA